MDNLFKIAEKVMWISFISLSDTQMVATVVNIVVRAGTGTSMMVLFVMTPELFPTLVRQTVIGSALGAATILSLAAPYVGGDLVSMF